MMAILGFPKSVISYCDRRWRTFLSTSTAVLALTFVQQISVIKYNITYPLFLDWLGSADSYVLQFTTDQHSHVFKYFATM